MRETDADLGDVENEIERASDEAERREAMAECEEGYASRRAARRQQRRGLGAIGIATVALLCLAGGWAAADALSSTGVTQQGAAWSVSTAGDPNLAAQPTVSIAEEPSGLSGCSQSPATYQPTAGAGYRDTLYVGLNGTCAAGDPVESFAFPTPVTLTAETLTLYATVTTPGATLTGSVAIAVDGGDMGDPGTLTVELDLGKGAFPTIEQISVVAN